MPLVDPKTDSAIHLQVLRDLRLDLRVLEVGHSEEDETWCTQSLEQACTKGSKGTRGTRAMEVASVKSLNGWSTETTGSWKRVRKVLVKLSVARAEK